MSNVIQMADYLPADGGRRLPHKTCGKCGNIRLKKGMIHSRYTGAYYCPDDCREALAKLDKPTAI